MFFGAPPSDQLMKYPVIDEQPVFTSPETVENVNKASVEDIESTEVIVGARVGADQATTDPVERVGFDHPFALNADTLAVIGCPFG